MSKASYAVVLGGGTAEYVGPMEKLLQNPASAEDAGEGIHGLEASEKESTSALRNSLISTSDESLSTTFSDGQSQEHPSIDTHELGSEPSVEDGIEGYASSGRPKKIIREERRETGRTKFSVYKGYLRAASTWPWVYWSVVISLLIG